MNVYIYNVPASSINACRGRGRSSIIIVLVIVSHNIVIETIVSVFIIRLRFLKKIV